MNKGFTVESILVRCSSMVDGGMALGFHTKELSSEEKANVMDYHNKSGWLLFKENDIELADVPKGVAEAETKTPSQRLRAVLFILWKQEGEQGEFEQFYRARMEQLIDLIKKKLDG